MHRFDEIFDFVASKPHGQAVKVETAFQSRGFCLKSFSVMKLWWILSQFDLTQQIQEIEIETK